MEILNVNEDVLEIREVSVDEIINEISIQENSENSDWLTKDLIIELWQHDPLEKKKKDCYLLWMRNRKVVGFSYLQEVREKEAVISFKTKEEQPLSSESLQALIELSIQQSFTSYHVEKIFFSCRNNCSSSTSASFIEYFHPHPIGWVHLNDHKFVLTRAQFEKTEEEFYKM